MTVHYKTYSIKEDVYYFCLELCEKLELFDYVFYSKAGLGEDIARVLFKRILKGIDYLHTEKNIAHRDIKTENLFLNDDFEIKIGDFGFSKIVSSDNKLTKTSLGTPGYEAPEVIEGKFYKPMAYDMFSLGIVLFTITYGFPPFKEARKTDSHYRYVAYNKKDVFWEKHSKRISPSTNFKILINSLIEYDFNTRATVKDVFNSIWLNEKGGLVEEENAINKLKSLYPSVCKAKTESIETMTIEKHYSCNNINYQYRNIESNRNEDFRQTFSQEEISSLEVNYLNTVGYNSILKNSKYIFQLHLNPDIDDLNENPILSILEYMYISISNIAEFTKMKTNENKIQVEIDYRDDENSCNTIKVQFNIEIAYFDPNFVICLYPYSNISLFKFNDIFENIKIELKSLIE
jgi:serine/threonine protein kinase